MVDLLGFLADLYIAKPIWQCARLVGHIDRPGSGGGVGALARAAR